MVSFWHRILHPQWETTRLADSMRCHHWTHPKFCGTVNPKPTGSQLFKNTIGPLVNKAIAYLQELLPSAWESKIDMPCGLSGEIIQSLKVQSGDNAIGSLHRQVEENKDKLTYVLWICKEHLHKRLSLHSLEGLGGFSRYAAGNSKSRS